MINIVDYNNFYEVFFAYNPRLIGEIKGIPGRRFNIEKKCWTIPVSSKDQLINWASRYRSSFQKNIELPIVVDDTVMPDLKINIPLKKELFPYQKQGVAYAIDKKRVIIADQPGLGKTAQAIAVAEAVQAKCVLVICPATLKENWYREFKMWSNRKPMILCNSVKKSFASFYRVGMANAFICNYESLKKYFVQEIKQPIDEKTGKKKPLRLNHIKFNELINMFDMVIVDEAHRCKDGKNLQTKLVMGISKGKEYILALTGTPVVNKPKDLLSQLYIIQHLNESFGGYQTFMNQFCFGPKGASNLSQLNYLLKKNCYYRREKKEVLTELPEKMRQIVKCEITTEVEYNKALNDLETFLRENLKKTDDEISKSMRGEIMVRMGILKKISAEGKIETVADYIQEVVDANEKIVVFVHHKSIANSLKTKFPGALMITGDHVGIERQSAIDNFQNDLNCNVIICSIKAAGVGITLTASSRVAFVELPWHQADCDQCEDRCHRIGQKDSVQCTYFLGSNTIDEHIFDIIQRKRKIANEITGTDDNIEVSIIDELISIFKK